MMSRGCGRGREDGTTFIELSIVALIMTILLISLTNALRNVTGGGQVAKERVRALALAQDKIEEVKARGYQALVPLVSGYTYPDDPDLVAPLQQKAKALPYPAVAPNPGEDPWTPESVLSGQLVYWRHVKIKCVEETATGLQQRPLANPPLDPGGTDSSSNLMQIEVDVTWYSRFSRAMHQVRVTSLLANMQTGVSRTGRICGTIFDDGTNLASAADDTVVLGKSLVVYTTNIATGESFSAPVKANGTYEFYPLPDGEYIIKLAGGAEYLDSAYGTTNDPVPSATAQAVTITAGYTVYRNIGIWTVKSRRSTVYGNFTGAAKGESIAISADDGLSLPLEFAAPADCDSSPCPFTISNVAWPTAGAKSLRVTLANRSRGTFFYATVCMDSAASATYFCWGQSPACAQPCGGGCGSPCQQPGPTVTLSATPWGNTPASVGVMVNEYYNLTYGPLRNARVILSDGTSATKFTAASGTVLVTGVAPSLAGTVKVSVSMTVSGYTTDSRTISSEVPAGQTLDLTSAPFVLRRVSTVSGTVWKYCDGGSPPCGSNSVPLANVTVAITNPDTNFSNMVVTDAGGRFCNASVVQETSNYTITPAVGADYTASPADMEVLVSANGKCYWQSTTPGGPLEFVMTAVNGVIKGTVKKAGAAYQKGAIVIATTYSGAFPTTLPSASLGGSYTYSTITLTDGTYTLKVATSVGNYTLHVFSPDNPTVSVNAGPYAPPAGGEVTAADLVIP